MHTILNCNMYEDLRDALFKKASECSLDFDCMSDEDKFMFLFSNINFVRPCVKTCALILQRRQFFICKR